MRNHHTDSLLAALEASTYAKRLEALQRITELLHDNVIEEAFIEMPLNYGVAFNDGVDSAREIVRAIYSDVSDQLENLTDEDKLFHPKDFIEFDVDGDLFEGGYRYRVWNRRRNSVTFHTNDPKVALNWFYKRREFWMKDLKQDLK